MCLKCFKFSKIKSVERIFKIAEGVFIYSLSLSRHIMDQYVELKNNTYRRNRISIKQHKEGEGECYKYRIRESSRVVSQGFTLYKSHDSHYKFGKRAICKNFSMNIEEP